jgi:hypothetical protein
LFVGAYPKEADEFVLYLLASRVHRAGMAEGK